jgi:hypothetical protein
VRDLSKAQITIGLLAYFATIWYEVLKIINSNDFDLLYNIGVIFLQLALILILSYIILAILEWIRLYDLKTNSILTLIVIVAVRVISSL